MTLERTAPLNGAGIVQVNVTYGSNVTHVKIDSAVVAIAEKNAKGLPTVLVVKLNAPKNEVALVYATRTPTFNATIVKAAGNISIGYKLLDAKSVRVLKGAYFKVRE